MASEPPETVHTVVITEVRDETTRKRVAHALEKVSRNVSREKIESRLNRLPWTLTRSATPKRAARLYRLLARLGATVEVVPPLAPAMISDVEETQILPGAHMLSETQVASATQFTSFPGGESPVVGGQTVPAETSSSRKAETPEPTRDFDASLGFEIEPMTLGGILDRAFQMCRAHFWKLFAVVAIPWLITLAMFAVIGVAAVLVGLNIRTLDSVSTWVLIILGVTVVPSVAVIAIALFYLSQGAVIHAVSSIYLGREILVRDAYRFVLARLGKYFLTSMLFLLAVFGLLVGPVIIGVGFYFLFALLTSSGWWSAVTWLPLIFLSAYCVIKLLVFDKVVIIEDIAYGKALSRSWNLLTGKAEGVRPARYWVRFYLLILILILINIAISILFETPATVLGLAAPQLQLYGSIIGQVLKTVGNVIAGLFGSVCMVVFYYDIRNRKEGFDLKMLSRIDRGPSDAD
ncbi:MAG: hypothetical protein RDU20_17625 [Desulfomonilaceae bacterium]|nr:hypothetical protein [Desulfomonilaceae bacterium]